MPSVIVCQIVSEGLPEAAGKGHGGTSTATRATIASKASKATSQRRRGRRLLRGCRGAAISGSGVEDGRADGGRAASSSFVMPSPPGPAVSKTVVALRDHPSGLVDRRGFHDLGTTYLGADTRQGHAGWHEERGAGRVRLIRFHGGAHGCALRERTYLM